MFSFKLAQSIKEKSAETDSEPPSQALIRLEADYTAEGVFGTRILEVTQECVNVIEPDNSVSATIAVSDIETACCEAVVGGGKLIVVTKNGEKIPVVMYSLTSAGAFTEAARGIQQLVKGEPFNIVSSPETTRCPKCNRLLPKKDGICPACLSKGKTIMRITRFLKPYIKNVVLIAFISTLGIGISLVPPKLQGMLVDQVFTYKAPLTMLWKIMAVWGAMHVFYILLTAFNGRTIAHTANGISSDIRSSLYRAIQFLHLGYFDKKSPGEIISRVLYDTERIQSFLVDGVPHFVTNTLLIVGIIFFLFYVNPVLALCVLAPVPVVVLISALAWKPVSMLSHRVAQRWSRFYTQLAESVSGIRVVKAFAKEDHENSKFQHRNNDLKQAAIRASTRWYVVYASLLFAMGLGTLINWTVGGWMVYNKVMTLGEFIQFSAYIGMVYGPLTWFSQVNNMLSQAMAGAERVFEVMDTESEKSPDDIAYPITGDIEFDKVTFGYDKSEPALKEVSFKVKAGQMIGLVGRSGAGKSTTINLLCRFYEPDSGVIKIDGVDIRNIPLREMRKQIGVVLQEPFLFNGTIAQNIAYGKSDATFAEIVQAAKAANAHDFILSKPHGYDTVTGEKGAQLSGGERQRISIARAILHNPRILILDEATSSVDVETESKIQEAINRLVQGRTTFAIAHRLSTLRDADRLIILDRGEVIENGTHEELMQKRGTFYKLVERQSEVNKIVTAN